MRLMPQRGSDGMKKKFNINRLQKSEINTERFSPVKCNDCAEHFCGSDYVHGNGIRNDICPDCGGLCVKVKG